MNEIAPFSLVTDPYVRIIIIIFFQKEIPFSVQRSFQYIIHIKEITIFEYITL